MMSCDRKNSKQQAILEKFSFHAYTVDITGMKDDGITSHTLH